MIKIKVLDKGTLSVYQEKSIDKDGYAVINNGHLNYYKKHAKIEVIEKYKLVPIIDQCLHCGHRKKVGENKVYDK